MTTPPDEEIVDFRKVGRWIKDKFRSSKSAPITPADKLQSRSHPPTDQQDSTDSTSAHSPAPSPPIFTDNSSGSDNFHHKHHINHQHHAPASSGSSHNYNQSHPSGTDSVGDKKNRSPGETNIAWAEFYRQHARWLIPLLFLALTITASLYLRTMPLRMPLADDWAASTAENFYRSQLSNQISQQYPNLPEQNKGPLIEREWQKYRSDNAATINAQISQTAEHFRSQFRDDTGTLYILGIDPYHYFRMVSNILNGGHQGTSYRDGISWDDYFLYPEGRYAGKDFHAYAGAVLYKVLNIFAQVPPMTSFFMIGVLFSALSAIPAFFIARKVSGNNVGGFYAALVVATSSFYVARTTGESSDTDVYTVFFPLLITWLFLEAYDSQNTLHRYILSVAAGISTGLFALAWGGGWWYIFLFLIVSTIAQLLISQSISAINTKFSWSRLLSPLGTISAYITSTGIFITLLLSFREFWYGFIGPIGFLNIKSVAVYSLWPNIRTTVAELNVPPFSSVVTELGGTLILTIACVGVILSLRRRDGQNHPQSKNQHLSRIWAFLNRDYTFAILLAIWLGSSLFATTKGVRFILQVIPAMALGVGIALGIAWEYLSFKIHRTIKINKMVTMVLLFMALSLIFIQPVKAGYRQAYGSVPSMNDQWYNTLTKIDREGDKEAVINSWWDFGHWFKAIGNRPVTFDGAAQIGYDAYWIGHALLVSDERQTTGILRMLNCGQNKAFDTLHSITNNTPLEIETLNLIVTMSRDDALGLLQQNGLNSEQSQQVLNYTHCQAPTDYFITSEDMIGKAGVWGHFGSWNFQRAEMYKVVSELPADNAISLLVSKYNLTEDVARQNYQQIKSTPADQWITGWPSFLSGISGCSRQNDLLMCPVNMAQGRLVFQVNLSTYESGVPNNQGSLIPPAVMVYATPDSLVEKRAAGASFGLGVILLPTGDDNYGVILTDPLHATSVFTKLFFFEGHALKCFTNFDHVRQFTGGKISTWVVNYECNNQPNNVFFPPIEKVTASHLLIAVKDGRSQNEALSLVHQIKNNLTTDNFADYAIKYSEDPGSASKGGSLGEFGRGVMVKEFEDAAFALTAGEISDPIRTQFGYHLIYVTDKKTE